MQGEDSLTEDSITAKAAYGKEIPSENNPPESYATTMSGGGMNVPSQAPPDLPSLLLNSRICYLGMPITESVTEIIIAQLLWLGYENPQKPVYMYINSTGSQSMRKTPIAHENNAYAILDTMRYIRCEIQTVCIGKAFGTGAMLLAAGTKGRRHSLPHASIMTTPPKMNRTMDPVTNLMIKANELNDITDTYIDLMTEFTGHDREKLVNDLGRTRYFTPEKAIEYGIVDKIVQEPKIEAKDYDKMLAQAQQRMEAAA